ncbi:MAG: dihydroorotate dehydrogenase electron transfer subunit [Methanobrevibacter sp.]|jgi:dihydroorotate dehydrogenase electron transfer subunit|nr:dihydroorotate dehydrogenase electron transfer subunit [Candidatus Methanovirga aequatorialis]
MNNGYQILEIKDIVFNTETIKTFIFNWKMEGEEITKPGQFMMVWNFNGEGDEKPMSLSKIDLDNEEIGITVKNVGKFTNNLHSLKIGDELGIRGPYGNNFNLNGDNILAIGGGVGMAPLKSFVEHVKSKNKNVDVVIASITQCELLFEEDFKKIGVDVFTSTDDGTCGYKGFATHRTIDLLKSRTYDMAVVCGPEIMMKGILNILEDNGIPGQYSMERYMKCAVGICGQCCVDNTGWRVCIEGPIFSSEEIKQITEFGNYHRDGSGIKRE